MICFFMACLCLCAFAHTSTCTVDKLLMYNEIYRDTECEELETFVSVLQKGVQIIQVRPLHGLGSLHLFPVFLCLWLVRSILRQGRLNKNSLRSGLFLFFHVLAQWFIWFQVIKLKSSLLSMFSHLQYKWVLNSQDTISPWAVWETWWTSLHLCSKLLPNLSNEYRFCHMSYMTLFCLIEFRHVGKSYTLHHTCLKALLANNFNSLFSSKSSLFFNFCI